MKKSATHQAALRYAEKGISVFPCVERGKHPATENGYKDATTDPAIIDAWFTKNPNFNVAAPPHAAGCVVVDIDAPGAIADLRERYGEVPATFTVQTASGGFHWWFKGEAKGITGNLKKNKEVHGLAPKVDVQGIGRYVLLAPSIVDYDLKEAIKKGRDAPFTGSYKVVGKNKMVQFPTVYSDALKAQEARNTAESIAAPDHELDLPFNIQRGREEARKWPQSFTGTIDDDTYKHAASLADKGLSPQVIYDIIKEEWYDRTGTDGNLDRLHTVAWSGKNNRQNADGVWAVQDPAKQFAAFEGQIFPDSAKSSTSSVSKYLPLNEHEQDNLPPPTWLLPNVLPDKALTILYAPPSAGKTFLALDWCMSIAAGLQKWGAVEQGATAFISAEGPHALGVVRRPAWRLLHGISTPVPFHIVPAMPYVVMPESVDEVVAQIKEHIGPIKLLVIDTLARFMAGMDESGTKDASIAIEALEKLKRELKCAIVCLHHTGHGNTARERGSSVFRASFDTSIELVTDMDSGTSKMWVRKHKDAPIPGSPWLLKAETIGDSMAFRFAEPEEMPMKDRLTSAEVGFQLDRMKVTVDNPVSAHVLAMELAKIKEGWTEKKTLSALRALSKSGRLGAYEVAPGGPFFFPAIESEIPF